MDKRTENAIETLHPKIRKLVTIGVNKALEALSGRADMIIIQALRTFPEQDALYKKRPKVTNAKAGQSYHNYGLAFDFCLKIDGKDISWDTVKDFDGDKKSDWYEVIAVFEELGFKSGKSFNDLPHFEMSFGYSWRQLLAKYNAKDFIPGTVYLNL